MKRLSIISIIVLGLLVSGCNWPSYQGTTIEGADDRMATEIAKILTATPVEIEISPTPEDVEGEITSVPEETEETSLPEETEETSLPEETEETSVPEETEETSVPEETEETQEPPTETPEGEQETAEPTATPEPTHTPTIAPTPTLADTDPASTLGDPDWVDRMENGDNWATGINEYTGIDFEHGYLKLTTQTEVDGWRLSWPYLEDFYLEVSVQSPECEGGDHFGVMFRVPEGADANKGYLFGITCDGRYSLRRWDGQTMHFPINWTEDEAVNQGENVVNKLGVMAQEATITLYINGHKVDQVVNDAYLEGQFGLFVGGTNVEDLTVWVDEVRYWENP